MIILNFHLLSTNGEKSPIVIQEMKNQRNAFYSLVEFSVIEIIIPRFRD